MKEPSAPDELTIEYVQRARKAISGLVLRTPVLRSDRVDETCQGEIYLKAENLQWSGSFKLRGASAKVRLCSKACAKGVVAGTAGNHGQAVALAAQRQGIACDLFVPRDAPISKIAPAVRLGATLHFCEGGVDECIVEARTFADARGATLIHPFDDPQVIAGQGTIALELVDDVAGLDQIIVPLGGGGLAAGVAVAVKSRHPEVEVIGVQTEACAPYPQSLAAGRPLAVEARQTVADGIAVKRPGWWTLPLVQASVDRVVVVTEEQVGDALALLLLGAKLVVEGAGAVGIAALLGGQVTTTGQGATAVILSGGNIDEETLIAVARRSERQSGRSVVLSTTISDRPGSLARLLDQVAAAGANVVDVSHIREGVALNMAETVVEMILETRGSEHTDALVSILAGQGYEAREVYVED